MRRLPHLILLVLGFFHYQAAAQNFSSVTATKIQNASGTLLVTGQLCFLGTDQNNIPISFQAGGGGQVYKRPVCTAVTNGVISGFQVANPGVTSPQGSAVSGYGYRRQWLIGIAIQHRQLHRQL
jgi:hypothetical protein